MIRGSNFRVGTEASFIYSSTITIGGVPVAGVASVDLASGDLHADRTTDSGLYTAEHIDVDPTNTTPDGVFAAQNKLPYDLPAGDHDLVVTSCWRGLDDAYPGDGIAPRGTEGLGGGVNDRIAMAPITIVEGMAMGKEEMMAGSTGFQGPAGPQGPLGPQGPRGLTGPEGPSGAIFGIIAIVVAGLALILAARRRRASA
ncbi:MAG: collagen-like protein [Chloroflexi bacterium]|nr:collagen-like protein [Chloroflexota bacterium]